jgi:hypothetical protein
MNDGSPRHQWRKCDEASCGADELTLATVAYVDEAREEGSELCC